MADETGKSRDSKKARVIPLRVVDGGAEDFDDLSSEDFYAERVRKKSRSSKKSPMSKAMRNPLSEDALDTALQSLALEEGKLLWEQEQEELRGYLDLELIDRRVKIIGKVADLIIKRRAALNKNSLDLHGMQFRKVLEDLIDQFRVAMEKSGIGHSKVEDIMVKFADQMEGWEDRMNHKLYGE